MDEEEVVDTKEVLEGPLTKENLDTLSWAINFMKYFEKKEPLNAYRIRGRQV